MTDIPDWLWQGMAIWAAGKSIEWAWKHREEIRNKVRTRQPVLISAAGGGRGSAEVTLTVGKSVDKPLFARRLEELAAWYLHVS